MSASTRHADWGPLKQHAKPATLELEPVHCDESYGGGYCPIHRFDCPEPLRSVWKFVRREPDALELKLSFDSCTKCVRGKVYKQAGNAANHFKRCHLRLPTDARKTGSEIDATPTLPTKRKGAAVAPTATALKDLGYLKLVEVATDQDYHVETDEHVPSDALQNSAIQPLVTTPSRDNQIYDCNVSLRPYDGHWSEDDGNFSKSSASWPEYWIPLLPAPYQEKPTKTTSTAKLIDPDLQTSPKAIINTTCDPRPKVVAPASVVESHAMQPSITKTHDTSRFVDGSFAMIQSNPHPMPETLPRVQYSPGFTANNEADPSSFSVRGDQTYHGNTQTLWHLFREPVNVSGCSNTVETPLRSTDSPHHSSETLSTTPDSASQHHVQRNPFIRRLRRVVKQIASEEASDYSINQESDTDSDNTSILSEDLDSHGDDPYDNDTPDSDTPGSSGSHGTGGHRPSANTTQGSSGQAGGSSRTNTGPINGHDDSARVQTDTSGTPNNQAKGTVIRCPLSAELECEGKDDNMSSLLRELSNNAHNTFYCNTCKILLSRIARIENATTEDTRRLRIAHNEDKSRWVAHTRACHDFHCAMRACAPDPDGDLRHKPNEKCQTKREEEKQADVDYLYRLLGIAQQDVQLGFKTDHKGKRKSCVRKAVEIATEAAQRNVEAESELRDCREENEKLMETNGTCCRRIEKLESEKEELYSILRHALEDLKRDQGAVTEALHDRIKRHAPSVLEKYQIGPKAAISTAPAIQGAPRTPSSLSQEPVGTTDQTSSSLPPPAKRRRFDLPTPNDVPNGSSSGSQPGFYTPLNDGMNQRATNPRTGASPFIPGNRHDSAVLGVEGDIPPRNTPSWQQTPQHITNSMTHQDTINPIFTGLASASIENSDISQEHPDSPIDFGFQDPNAPTIDFGFPKGIDGFNQLSAGHYGQSGGGLPGR